MSYIGGAWFVLILPCFIGVSEVNANSMLRAKRNEKEMQQAFKSFSIFITNKT